MVDQTGLNSLDVYICEYENKWTDEVGEIPVCKVHDNNSKWGLEYGSHRPCLTVDPWGMSRTTWTPTRWWRVMGPAGEIWAESSDEQEVRDRMRTGDELYRLYEQTGAFWKKEN